MTVLHQPGHDRGLGRHARGLRDTLSSITEFEFVEYRGTRSRRAHRFSELTRIPPRSVFIARHAGWFHAINPYNLDPFHLANSVVTLHDLVPLDLQQYSRSGLKARVVHDWVKRCPVIATPSHHSAHRAAELLEIDPSRIVVAPLPVVYGLHSSERCQRDCLDAIGAVTGPYVSAALDMRSFDPRKRLPWILGAARHISEHGVSVFLYGGGTEGMSEGLVRGVGRICDVHMRELLAGSACFIYASAYEGQGLPPQEALVAGTPVVAFSNTSLPEALGPGALWLSERPAPWSRLVQAAPDDPEAKDLAEAALELIGDAARRDSLARAGAAHVASFTQESFRDQMRAVYGQLTTTDVGEIA